MAEAAPRTLLLVRHGRTAWNAEGRAQGHTDVPLDDDGRAQAAQLAQRLSGRSVAALWSSDLVRASETAAGLGSVLGLPVTLDARLREFHVGERQGLTAAEYAERHPDSPPATPGLLGVAVPVGAEAIDQVRKRMSAALADLLAGLAPGETGIAVVHGTSLRVAVPDLLGWPWEQVRNLAPVGNCHWVEVAIDADGRGVLVAYNTCA